MPRFAFPYSRGARRGAALLATLLAAASLPAQAAAHGGVTLAEGSQDGVTIRLQAIDGTTASGKPGADLSTVLAGPGTGERAEVTYWVRPDGGKTFKVEPERDADGVHHATIATAGRGDWRAWDVSAVVTLSSGERLRVTNASGTAPGPDPAAKPAPAPAAKPAPAPAADEPGSTSAAPTTPAADPPAADDAGAVADISGEASDAPSWMVPSLIVLAVLGGLVLVLQRRRRDD